MPDSYRFELTRDRPWPDGSLQENSADNYHDLLTQMRVIVGSVRLTQQGDRFIWTCTLGKSAEAATIRTAVNDLRQFLNAAMEYVADPIADDSLYFRWQTNGEEAKRSLVYSYTLEPLDNNVEDIHLDSDAARYLLSLTLTASFEERLAQEATITNINTCGGVWRLSATIQGGEVTGRIPVLKVSPRNTSNDLEKMWIGIRPLRNGVGAAGTNFYFNPVLEFSTQYSLGVTGVTNETSESNTVSAQHMEDDFSGGEDLAFKFSYNLGSSAGAYIGRYLVLLRCKIISGTGVCLARVSTSYSSPEYSKPVALGVTQYLTNTSWRFIEMGEIELPGGRGHSSLDLQSLRINLETGRVSGTAVLGVDCFVLIPSDHYITWSGAAFGNSGSPDTDAWIMTHPDNSVEGYVVGPSTGFLAFAEGQSYDYAEIGGRNWGYPHQRPQFDGGVLVLAAQRSTNQTVTDNIDLEIEVKRRWQTYRV